MKLLAIFERLTEPKHKMSVAMSVSGISGIGAEKKWGEQSPPRWVFHSSRQEQYSQTPRNQSPRSHTITSQSNQPQGLIFFVLDYHNISSPPSAQIDPTVHATHHRGATPTQSSISSRQPTAFYHIDIGHSPTETAAAEAPGEEVPVSCQAWQAEQINQADRPLRNDQPTRAPAGDPSLIHTATAYPRPARDRDH